MKPWLVSHRSASRAAMAPVPADVTAYIAVGGRREPAAWAGIRLGSAASCVCVEFLVSRIALRRFFRTTARTQPHNTHARQKGNAPDGRSCLPRPPRRRRPGGASWWRSGSRRRGRDTPRGPSRRALSECARACVSVCVLSWWRDARVLVVPARVCELD